jgi:regulatory protein
VTLELVSPDIEKAREAALRMLDRSRRTRRELERRLGEAGHAREAIAAALDRLARVGVVDDAEYARAFARAKLAKRGIALRVVRQELKRRGVGDADLEEGLAAFAGGDGERARAEQALLPLWRRHRALDPPERRARCAAALARRGFDYDTVRDVLEALRESESAG